MTGTISVLTKVPPYPNGHEAADFSLLQDHMKMIVLLAVLRICGEIRALMNEFHTMLVRFANVTVADIPTGTCSRLQ